MTTAFLSVVFDAVCLIAILLLAVPASRSWVVSARNHAANFVRAVPILSNLLILLGWIHPRFPEAACQRQQDETAIGEAQVLLPTSTTSSAALASDRYAMFLLDLPAAQVAAAIPRFKSLWWTLIACSLGHIVFEATTLAVLGGTHSLAFPNGTPTSSIAIFAGPSLAIWTIVIGLQLTSSESHPTALIVATASSTVRSIALASIHSVSTFSSLTAFHLYLSILALTICFVVFGAVRGRREDEEDEALRNAKILVPSREIQSSLFARYYFTWVSPLLRLGTSKNLDIEDLPDLPPSDKAEVAVLRFESFAKTTKIKHLGLQLLWLEFPCFSLQVFWSLLANLLSVCSPFVLHQIVKFIENGNQSSALEPIFLASMLGLISIFKSCSDGQAWHTGRRMGIRLRSVLVNAIYKKGLRKVNIAPSAAAANALVSSGKDANAPANLVEVAVDDKKGKEAEKDAKDEKKDDKKDEKKKEEKPVEDDAATVGKIVTLMSSDAEKIRESCAFLYFLFTSPPQIIISLAGLIYLLGWPAFAGLFIMLLTFPATYYISKIFNVIFERLMAATDKRTDVVNEALQGIRIIKFFAWETNFLRKIKDARTKEMNTLIQYFITTAFSFLIWDGAPLMVSFGTFLVYTYVAGYELDAKTAFASISLFNSLRIPLLALPEIIVDIFQLNVSIGRIQKFLDGEELEKYDPVADTLANDVVDAPKIGFKDGWFSWRLAEEPKKEEDKKASKGKDKATKDETTPLLASASSASLASNVSTESTTQTVFTLRNLNIEVPEGGLTCVTGATGSGKSSLIQALLGEMKRLSGSAHLPTVSTFKGSNVAYVAQTSWLMNATIRDNICFGEAYDVIRYDRVIKACALVKDLATFEAGDLTEIGEKGINLSGGQKQRVSLARAVYSYAKFILLDDPLSAVDAPTARHLFDHAICGLLKDRTRILVTHAVGLTLPKADHLIVLANGEVLASGDVTTVLATPGVDAIVSAEASAQILREVSSPSLAEGEVSVGSVEGGDETNTLNLTDYGNGKTREDARKLVEKEESQKGSVKLTVYFSYLAAAGGAIWVLSYIIALSLERGAQAMDSFWIKHWVEAYKEHDRIVNGSMPALDMSPVCPTRSGSVLSLGSLSPMPLWLSGIQQSSGCASTVYKVFGEDGIEIPPVNTAFFVGVYGGIVVLWILFNQGALAIRCFGSFTASKYFHDSLIDRILGAPIRFFDKTPIGRILNRASKDIAAIDREVIMSYHFFFALVLDIITITVIVTYIIPFFIIAFVPFGFIYYNIAKQYLASSRELKRMDSVSRSPIYSMFSETLVGASTIRAYGAEQRFQSENMRRLNTNHRAYYYLWASNRWLGVRISTVAGLVICVSASITVFSRNLIGPELAGIALIWSLNFSDYLIWLIRVHAQLEMSLNAVERVGEYLVIEQEKPAVIEGMRPGADWPTRGAISVKDLELRYSPELEPVLKNVNFEIPGGAKVGIVGRTGAGKSSLTLALFRIVEPSGGIMTIDGINISEIGLRDLRSKLTIIPQDPVLFAGTIRSNMDPFDEYDDARIWACLERVHILETMQTASSATMSPVASSSSLEMKKTSSSSTLVAEDNASEVTANPGSSPLSLDSVVAEGGSNFSQGQRQLLCLARALLKSSKVTILDEATASVDNETDGRIQETIRGPDFANVTVISIAHRLRTVADYDLILVLEKGEVSQFGSPWELLNKEGGIFRTMCEESGEFTELEEMARNANEKRRQ
ncbi:hypothetical protein HDU97_008125 [Phlyctochytrium planicorne]|nr:hypothetical protein HDU97_008125 [Phlyctochytrium planicorne]